MTREGAGGGGGVVMGGRAQARRRRRKECPLSPVKKRTATMEPVVKVSWVSEDCRLTSGEAVEMVMRFEAEGEMED
jgi:hypothetical protein